MTFADWGEAIEAAHFPGARVSGFELVDSDDPRDLPAVLAAVERGYEPAPEAPMWCFLPAVWPVHARLWIHDRRIRRMTVACEGQPVRRVPWSAADYAEVESDVNSTLNQCGLPSRPFGRLWLLSPPPGVGSLDEALTSLVTSATAEGLEPAASAAFVEHVAHELVKLFDR